jgi:phospholipid N-methyltransferase
MIGSYMIVTEEQVQPTNHKQKQITESKLPIHQLPLAKRDEILERMERQIEEKRRLLIHKNKQLSKLTEENEFLGQVKRDYEKYNSYIANQKQEQIRAFYMLNKYLDDIIISGKLTDKDIEKTKQDQKMILREIDTVKQNLDEIVSLDEITGTKI